MNRALSGAPAPGHARAPPPCRTPPLFDSRPAAVSLGKLAEATTAGVALALEARTSVCASGVMTPGQPATTGMYPPEPPTFDPWSAAPVEPPIFVGVLVAPHPFDPGSVEPAYV